MSGAPGFERNVDDRVAQVDTIIGAVVQGLDDVRPLIGEDFGELVQRSGPVREMDTDAHAAAVLDQSAFDDLGQQADVDVASADQHRRLLADQRGLPLQQGGKRNRARAFGQRLLLFEQHQNRVGDFLFIHGDQLVDIALDQGQGHFSGAADGDAVGNGRLGRQRNRLALLPRAQHRRQAFRLHSDHANRGLLSFRAQATPLMRPPPPIGTTTASRPGTCSRQFEADGSLAVDHRGIVEGVQKGRSLFRDSRSASLHASS